ncbi:methyltransferase domain-containing protein [Amycolatopsis thermophila]|uniref:Ubiquinone/menaquinone biosynthesis C-methylase UbiE n=1 Tax=Amycolatopsis thermophila TaxID=206084 RepID=A0ABU0EZ76_9PSEU|nr:methyltransferase domain-containing protein [Amycolatopsis thermophila]MDQ0380563.1 ubiquinone/menaquinone biosynthesis C-methylase UbiE [Amycolatopsis thermophila]
MVDTQSTFRTGSTDPAVVARLAEILDSQAATPGVQRLRAWAHDALAVRPGERALEIGCGTGSEVQVLAAAVGPGGEAIGLDPNEGMLGLARERAAGSPARFVPGDVYALPFADASLDAVLCERVFQHLTDPVSAVAEIARVLRPGGRVVLVDTDWATGLLHPGDPGTVRAMLDGMLGRTAQPAAGRKLAGWLSGAGLTVRDRGSQALISDWEPVRDTLLPMMVDTAVGGGVVTRERGDRLMADLADGAARGDFHMSVTMFAVLAQRV